MAQSQEEVIAIQLAKNHNDVYGQAKAIGSKVIVLGKLTEEQKKEYRQRGINIVNKGGEELLKLKGNELIEEILPNEEIQKELGIDTEFVPELWYTRRSFSIAKYFATKDEKTTKELLEVFIEEFKEGNIKETFGGKTTVYKLDTTIEKLLSLIEDFETLKKELGV